MEHQNHTHHEHKEHVPEHHTHIEKKKVPTISVPAAILTGSVLIALAIVFAFGPKKDTPAPTRPTTGQPTQNQIPTSIPAEIAKIKSDDHIRGNKNAEIMLIEYGDTDCSFCMKFHTTVEQILSEYNGKVAWVFRHFPLDMHPNAYTEAVALECVGSVGGNDAFQKYYNSIIGVTFSPDPKSNEQLTALAVQAGVNSDAFKACTATENPTKRITKDLGEVATIGAQGTPFNILVNVKTGEQVVLPGAYPIEAVKEAIDGLLN